MNDNELTYTKSLFFLQIILYDKYDIAIIKKRSVLRSVMPTIS